ncbi:hypothetical protein [Algoriphagus sp.]|uniref:hypothetical protein n=1 Tax=Algoriphagus sp. TaxID=1872435 RepID=UPI003918D86D
MYSPEYQHTFRHSNFIAMTKLIPIFIEGKKWIQLSQLSSDQVQSLKSILPVDCLKKVIFQGMELNDCLDFDMYEYWFKSDQISGQRHALLDF